MKALVTGATGFIGSRLMARLIRSGWDVRVLVRSGFLDHELPRGVTPFEGDICDPLSTKYACYDVDTIFHAAGKAHAVSELRQDNGAYYAVNVEGTAHVLDAALASGVARFVLFSSVKVIGERTSTCLDESTYPHPETAYGRSKLEAERLTLARGACGQIHVACLRLPMVYGPGEKGNLSRMIAAIERGLFPPLPEFGNRRSLVHVENVVDATLLAATKSEANGQVYNVTDPRPYSTRELYELTAKALGRPIPRWHVPMGVLRVAARVGDVIGRVRGRRWIIDSDSLEKLTGSAWYSCNKITRELGYKPTISFEQALPELIDWYSKSKA